METAGKAFWECVSFARLSVTCRALTGGYLAERPERKLRAVVKALVQALSPCADQRDMDCAACFFAADCLFRQLFTPDPCRDYLPYFLFTEEPQTWRGPISPGTDRRFSLVLAGRAASLLQRVSESFAQKPLFTLDSDLDAPIRLLFSEGLPHNNGQPVAAIELVNQRLAELKPAGGASGLSIEFTSPFCLTLGNRTLTRPELVDSGVFIEALNRRVMGLARDHCGFDGPFESSPETACAGVLTKRSPDFRFVHEEAFKRERNGRVQSQLLGGFLGKITFSGDLSPWLPLIILGEALGIGNDTTQGSGRYRILELK